MTAEYALLEQQEQEELQKPQSVNKSYKRWYIVGFTATGTALIILVAVLIFVRQQDSSTRESDEQQYETVIDPPARNINFSIPTQESPFYVDLDRYPIEDQLIQLFPSTATDSIRQYTIKKLSVEKSTTNSDDSWTEEWLSHQVAPNDATFDCDHQTLPYPILRRMVSEYLPVQNADRFFEDTMADLTNPFVVLPFAKVPEQLKPGQQICVRVVVPYSNVGKHDSHRLQYRPYQKNNADISTPWWDTMMTLLTDQDTKATIPIHMEPWKGHHELRQRARELNNVNFNIPEWTRLRDDEKYERKRMHIYEAQVTVPEQNGNWQLSSLLEFMEARYNFEFGPVSPYHPIELPVFPSGAHLWKVNNKNNQDLLAEHLALPLCKGFDHPGRWLPFPANATEIQNEVLGLTRDNKYWAPYECRYRHLSYEQFNRCAAKKYPRGMDLYGDSNIRRSIKKFMSHGQWCKDWHKFIKEPLLPDDQKPKINRTLVPRQDDGTYGSPQEWKHTQDEQTRNCYCEDFSEPFWNTEWFNPMARRSDFVYGNSVEQSRLLGVTEWDDNKTTATNTDSFPVSSYKWDGLTYLNIPGWQEAVPSSPPQADIAIFSLGNWDAAFGELEPYLRDVNYLIRQIKEHYDLTKTRIIYRTAQYYCCRIDVSGRTRQISGPRLDAFENEAIRIFKDELHAEIWDTYTLAESKTYDEKMVAITCSSNHVPADQVEIENQILMNGLCNF